MINMRNYIVPLLLGLFCLLPLQNAFAQEWQIDIDHSAAHFSIKHMTIAKVRGHFADLSGTATFNDKSGKLTDLKIKIGVTSINTGVIKRDDHLRSADFFEVSKYPIMTFVSKEIKEGAGKIIGYLTIKSTTKKVVLDLQGPTKTIKDPWGNLRKGAKLTTTINRNDFGITYNNLLGKGGLTIGNTVKIETDLEFLIMKSPD